MLVGCIRDDCGHHLTGNRVDFLIWRSTKGRQDGAPALTEHEDDDSNDQRYHKQPREDSDK
jgi:hypothetical protein